MAKAPCASYPYPSTWQGVMDNMRHIVNPQQGRLFDPFDGLIPPLGLERIRTGWQSIFRSTLLELIRFVDYVLKVRRCRFINEIAPQWADRLIANAQACARK